MPSENARSQIRLPPDLHGKLAELKESTGASINFSVVAAVRAYLDRPEIRAALKKKRGR